MSGATVLITGAARGIGLAIASAVIARGHRAILWDVEAQALEEARAVLGEKADIACVDVSDQDAVDDAAARLPEVWRPTHLVNNAGILGVKMGFDAMRGAEIDRVLSVNIRGLLSVTAAFLKVRADSADAAIVNMASIAGFNGGAPGHAVYAATKGAVLALTRAMARDLAPAIRVNALAPGIIETEMQKSVFASQYHLLEMAAAIPQKRLGTPRDVAEAAAWLMFAAPYTTGETIRVAGGRV